MTSAEWSDQLDLLIRARTPLIWVRSTEEQRVSNSSSKPVVACSDASATGTSSAV